MLKNQEKKDKENELQVTNALWGIIRNIMKSWGGGSCL